jgi:hypothetical protein
MTAYLLDTNVLMHLVNHASGYTHIKSRFAAAKPGSLHISAKKQKAFQSIACCTGTDGAISG